jgi:hypothetical protein
MIFTIIDHMPACKRGDDGRRVTKKKVAKDAIASKSVGQGPTRSGSDKEWAARRTRTRTSEGE